MTDVQTTEPESDKQRAERAYIARMRWRSNLHRLNGDEAGAKLSDETADLYERFLAAQHAYSDAGRPENGPEYDAFRYLKMQVQSQHRFWRGVREFNATTGPAATIDNFSEPSDDELLAGQEG